MDPWFEVCLRDLSASPSRFLVAIQATKGFENNTLTRVLTEFAREAQQVAPPHQNIDVYIGWWGNQDTFEIPKEFFELIAQRGWKVTFDIND